MFVVFLLRKKKTLLPCEFESPATPEVRLWWDWGGVGGAALLLGNKLFAST